MKPKKIKQSTVTIYIDNLPVLGVLMCIFTLRCDQQLKVSWFKFKYIVLVYIVPCKIYVHSTI